MEKGQKVILINVKRIRNLAIKNYLNCKGVVCSGVIEHSNKVLVQFDRINKYDISFDGKFWIGIDRLKPTD